MLLGVGAGFLSAGGSAAGKPAAGGAGGLFAELNALGASGASATANLKKVFLSLSLSLSVSCSLALARALYEACGVRMHVYAWCFGRERHCQPQEGVCVREGERGGADSCAATAGREF